MRFKVVLIICLMFLVVFNVYSLDIIGEVGMPFYGDGMGVLGVVGVEESFTKIVGLNIPLYGRGGISFQYARGVDSGYVVDFTDFGLVLGGEYVISFDKVGIGIGVDLYFSYGSSFNDLSSLGGVGANVRPNVRFGYNVGDKLGVYGRIGYNVGLYSWYMGYMYFVVGISLGL